MRDTLFAVRYAFETEEAADQEYRLRDSVHFEVGVETEGTFEY